MAVTAEQINAYVSSVLNNPNLTDSQRAQQINEAAQANGVTMQQIADATPYTLDKVQSYLGGNAPQTQSTSNGVPYANIQGYVSNVLNDSSLNDTQRADKINQAATQYGVSRNDISAATGYDMDTVNRYLGAVQPAPQGNNFYKGGSVTPTAPPAASPAPAPVSGDGYTSATTLPQAPQPSDTKPFTYDAKTASATIAPPTPSYDYTPAPTPAPQPQKAAEQLRVTPEMTVQGQLRNILDPNNPLMQQAATSGLQQAASRGLINSTIGQTAAADSMYRTALPIAQQDASTNSTVGLANVAAVNQFARDYNLNLNDVQKMAIAQSYNLQNMDIQQRNALALAAQQYGFNSALSSQGYNQNLGLNQQQYGFNSALSNQGYNQQLGLNQQGFGFNTALSDQNYRQTLGINAANVGNTNAINNNNADNTIKVNAANVGFTNAINNNNTDNQIRLSDNNTGNQQVLNTQNTNQQLDLQNNAAGNARQVAFTTGVNSLMSTLSQQIAAINANTSFTSPEAKQQMIDWQKNTTAAAVRTLASASGDIDATSFINNIMNIDSSASAAAASPTPTASAPTKPTSQQITQFVTSTLSNKSMTPQQQAAAIKQAMAKSGVSPIEVAAATGYTKNQVDQFLALAP